MEVKYTDQFHFLRLLAHVMCLQRFMQTVDGLLIVVCAKADAGLVPQQQQPPLVTCSWVPKNEKGEWEISHRAFI